MCAVDEGSSDGELKLLYYLKCTYYLSRLCIPDLTYLFDGSLG